MPELVLELNGQTWTLDPARAYSVGRDPQSDVVLNDARVSWKHATVRWGGRAWVLEDQGSTNGTYVQGQRIHQTEIGPGSSVHLGNATDGPRMQLSAAAGAARADLYSAQTALAAEPPPAVAPSAGAPPVQGGAPGGWNAPPQQQKPAGQGRPYVPPQGGAGGPQRAPVGAAPIYGDRSPTTFHRLDLGRVTRIGRALDNELRVDDLQVSRHHAEFRATPDGRFQIFDLGSHNGTYVNGEQLPRSGNRIIGPEDIIGVGHSTFRLMGDRLEEFVDTGEVSFSARRLTVTVGEGKKILNDVSFGVPEKSLVAVIGPSGSGKSTLLKALTGYRPATEGDVLYDNRNLYKQYAELRQRIGLVPQDDILHTQLTVSTALGYAAKLRFPGDTAEAERTARVDEVLRELKLDIHKDKQISSLSGGQRKRVSVALELLTKPSLIFLDEPTSGLDPGMDRDVMQLLRGLADDGRTVLVVTHSVAELALADRLLVMAPGGSVAYFGPPEEALNFFGYESWADVFQAFESYRDYDWSGRWHGSQHYQMYAADIDAVAPQSAAAQPQQLRHVAKPQSWGAQLNTLIRRYVSVIASDRTFILLMLALPIVLGVVSMVIPADFGLGPGPKKGPQPGANPDAGTIMLILAVGACFSGAANSVRELIKERVIYERERATGLSRSAYLMSKVVVLGLITILQGVIISGIGLATRSKMPESGAVLKGLPVIELAFGVIGLGLTSMMVGLIISSLVKTSEMTMPLLVMFAIVQVVFTGMLFQLHGTVGAEQIGWLMPSRWAVAAMGATADMNTLLPFDGGKADPLWKHTAGAYGLDMAVLLGMAVVCCFVVGRLLRRHEPEVMR
ncbi:MAG: FHA domain-containing protein [Kitasatospora sp.]|nr:FHA domain-containing protein [Kitasatospora sp.]